MNNKTKTIAKTNGARTKRNTAYPVRYVTVTAMLSAVAFILMFLDFPIPFLIPSFIKMDLSELPALIGSFAMGPVCGVLVCLVKNLLHLTVSSTGGVGELSNFLLGVLFVLPAGLIYRYKKNKRSAVIGSFTGAILMALGSIATNYLVVYPFYYNFFPKEALIAEYNAILQVFAPSMELTDILPCLICFNMPFTFLKGLFSVGLTMLVYKHISPILKGKA